jgi:hypothetical protein
VSKLIEGNEHGYGHVNLKRRLELAAIRNSKMAPEGDNEENFPPGQPSIHSKYAQVFRRNSCFSGPKFKAFETDIRFNLAFAFWILALNLSWVRRKRVIEVVDGGQCKKQLG